MLETLLGGLIGGAFRILPEVMNWLDRKDERKHELNMLNVEMQFAELRGRIEMGQAEIALSGKELDAMTEAIREQGQTAREAGKWVAGFSAMVRPSITYWLIVLYSLVKLATMVNAYLIGANWRDVLIANWTQDDMSLLMLVLTFWFVGRIYERQGRNIGS